jgi:hypothetical protein
MSCTIVHRFYLILVLSVDCSFFILVVVLLAAISLLLALLWVRQPLLRTFRHAPHASGTVGDVELAYWLVLLAASAPLQLSLTINHPVLSS